VEGGHARGGGRQGQVKDRLAAGGVPQRRVCGNATQDRETAGSEAPALDGRALGDDLADELLM
jgi:hypothetical protein